MKKNKLIKDLGSVIVVKQSGLYTKLLPCFTLKLVNWEEYFILVRIFQKENQKTMTLRVVVYSAFSTFFYY